jgi:hypothetical protein
MVIIFCVFNFSGCALSDIKRKFRLFSAAECATCIHLHLRHSTPPGTRRMEKLRRNWFFYSSSIRKYMGGKVSGGATEQKMYTHKSEKSPRHLQPERESKLGDAREHSLLLPGVSQGNFVCAVV